MILTKAFIQQLPEKDSNIYKVRIPLMEDNTDTPAIFDAVSCHTPGIYKEYSEEDCVFVCFENEQMITAVILGQLDTGEIPEKNNIYGILDNINVTGYASLPESTKIGNYTLSDLVNNINSASSWATSSASSGLFYKEVRTW